MDESLLKLLEQAGFTNKEARVYLALLELGRGDVTDIAKIADLKRSIVYVILEGLIKRGYANQLPDTKVNTYHAVDPGTILNTIEVTARHFREMLPIFQTLDKKGKNRPKIQYIETKDRIRKIYEEMSLSKDGFFITANARINKRFPGFLEDFIRNYKKGLYSLRGKHLAPDNQDEIEIGKKLIKADQEVRVLDKIGNINMDFAIFENKVAITSFEEEPFMVVFESEELVKSMLMIFEIAWQKGKEIK